MKDNCMTKLNQIIAIEKGIKSRTYAEIGELHKINQKSELFNGFNKQYQKKDEAGEDLPPERKKVQYNTDDILKRLQKLGGELYEVTARKDWTNMRATADVMVGEDVILQNVPVTYLLFLEKQITDLRTFIDNLPILDEAERWSKDSSSGLFKSDTVTTHRTKKIQKGIVLYDATDKHPAQTQLITEDIIAGHWVQEKHSGAMAAPEKQRLTERVDQLLLAVKEAREEANNIEEITPPEVGESIFEYIFQKGE